jgi:hypothetical protein
MKTFDTTNSRIVSIWTGYYDQLRGNPRVADGWALGVLSLGSSDSAAALECPRYALRPSSFCDVRCAG